MACGKHRSSVTDTPQLAARVVHSLGNFVFDQLGGGWVDEGAIVMINFKANGDLQVNFMPVVIENTSTPRFATQAEAEKILRRIASVSSVLEE